MWNIWKYGKVQIYASLPSIHKVFAKPDGLAHCQLLCVLWRFIYYDTEESPTAIQGYDTGKYAQQCDAILKDGRNNGGETDRY